MTNAIQYTDNYVAQTYRRPPFTLARGEGMRVWDTEGNDYLDLVAGIAVMALGHSDPQLTTLLQDQAGQLVHVSNLYYTAPQAELARALCEKSFAQRVFFCNSGAEANEGALKFARKLAYVNGEHERREFVAFSSGFHGRTMGALAVTPKAQYQDPYRPLIGDVTILPMHDADAARAHIGRQTAAVIVEPIQGEGGVHPADPAFLHTLREICDATGALLIFDEVQCGLGRTGTLWAHEAAEVTPDMMTLAKPLANGLPIGAVLMTEAVHQALEPGDHGSTFAGGPLVCTAALHVLERVSQPSFLQHVRDTGDYLAERLEEINSPHIQEVRGRGLMLGAQLNIPAADIVGKGYAHGLLTVNAGPNVLRLIPPLIMQSADVDDAIHRLTSVFSEV
ncbi:MAG: aspartate aminotransferase family protein [Anaerolineales bacterium]